MIYGNSWLEIDSKAIRANIGSFRKIIGSTVNLLTVIKSNAYGHGFLEVARICERAKNVDWLATVNLAEALELRKNKIKKPILVLSYYELNSSVDQAISQNISLVVYSQEQLKFLNFRAQKLNRPARIHIKIDTGTSRLGVEPENAIAFIKQARKLRQLQLEGIFTHYASAELINQVFSLRQTKVFSELLSALEKQGIRFKFKHAACSAAGFLNKAYHFNLARLGLSLYGLWSLEDGQAVKSKIKLQPALTWKTKIIQIKELSAGRAIGYGQTYRLKRRAKIATLPVGYWEGYDRRLSNLGEVLINGSRAKIRGRICMNLMMADVSGIKNVKVGDEAVLLGRQGSNRITADELAEKTGTINYEIVTRINPLILRKVV